MRGPQPQLARPLEPDRAVCGRDDQAAAGEMLTHQPARRVLRRRVERRGRLVEQPDRALHGDQPGERQPPPLAGRQIGRRQFRQRRETDRRQRRLDQRPVPPR